MATRRKDNKGRVLREGESQRTNGSYDFRWRDGNERHSIYAPTLEQLRIKENEIARDMADGIRHSSCTLDDMYARWCEVKRGLKENTFANYKYLYEFLISPTLGNRLVQSLRRSEIRAFYNGLAENRGIKTNSLEGVQSVLHQILQLAVDDEIIRTNPSDNALKELKTAHGKEGTKRRALTREEQRLFEEFLASDVRYQQWRNLFTVMLWTGMRVGELSALQWSDIDFDANEINVRHTLVYYASGDEKRECKYAMNTPKTRSGNRRIQMIQSVREALVAEKARQEELGIHCRSNVDGFADFVFCNRFGHVFNQESLNRALKRIIRDCNFGVMEQLSGKASVVHLPDFSCHSLRHTFATRLCEMGMSIKVAEELLGHSDVRVTMDIYTDVSTDFQRRELDQFEQTARSAGLLPAYA